MRSPRLAALGVALLLGATAIGCTSEPKDPAELRQERVEARLAATFSRSQANCILDVLDAPTVKALDRTTSLPAGSEAMRIYSNAVVACTA